MNYQLSFLADDTRIKLQIKIQLEPKILQDNLDNMIQWSSKNKMALHDEKFELICHSNSKIQLLHVLPFTYEIYKYQTDHTYLLEKPKTSELGVIISKDLTWKSHVSSKTNKTRKVWCWVLSVFQGRSRDTMLTLYTSSIQRKLGCCCSLWSHYNKQDIHIVENVQRAFTNRIIDC